MLIDMEIISMWNGKYDPTKRFCPVVDSVSRTIQDAIVDIPTLLKEFNGHLDDLFDKYNNGLLYESSIGVFVDELNKDELDRYNEFVASQEAKAKADAEEKALFEQFKSEFATHVQ